MKKIVLFIAVIILLGSCSYYAPTAKLHIENNAVKEELAEISDNK
jgi:hypothetical protein